VIVGLFCLVSVYLKRHLNAKNGHSFVTKS